MSRRDSTDLSWRSETVAAPLRTRQAHHQTAMCTYTKVCDVSDQIDARRHGTQTHVKTPEFVMDHRKFLEASHFTTLADCPPELPEDPWPSDALRPPLGC